MPTNDETKRDNKWSKPKKKLCAKGFTHLNS